MNLNITAYGLIRENKVICNNRLLFYQENIGKFADFGKALYKHMSINYPRFYKMNNLSKLGFLTAEMLMHDRKLPEIPAWKTGVVLANTSASLDTDLVHQESIKDRDAWFPSPSVFVYTLPNIVIGEICIRHGFKGENLFMVAETRDVERLQRQVNILFASDRLDACLFGWVEVLGNKFDSAMMLVEKRNDVPVSLPVGQFRAIPFDQAGINTILKHN